MSTAATDRVAIHCPCRVCQGRGTMFPSAELEGRTPKVRAEIVHNVVALAWSPLGARRIRLAA